MDKFSIDNQNLLEQSRELQSGLGAVAWATLEMLKRGGMPEEKLKQVQDDMNSYFAKPTNDECNTVLRVVEKRLEEDSEQSGVWYT